MTFEKWCIENCSSGAAVSTNGFYRKMWNAALAQARREEWDFAQQECRGAECVDVENAPVDYISSEYLEGWNEACRWIRAQFLARSQATP